MKSSGQEKTVQLQQEMSALNVKLLSSEREVEKKDHRIQQLDAQLSEEQNHVEKVKSELSVENEKNHALVEQKEKLELNVKSLEQVRKYTVVRVD